MCYKRKISHLCLKFLSLSESVEVPNPCHRHLSRASLSASNRLNWFVPK